MPDLRYQIVDVFTDHPFGGNPLAVFADAPPDLPADLMQRIAREFNLSETTFVLPPEDPANHFHVRIFTPAQELPMAGHPTVGTAYILARMGKAVTHGRCVFRFEEGVGLIPVTVDMQMGEPHMIWMQQPAPRFGPAYEDRRAIAELLLLSPDDMAEEYPLEVVSTGVPCGIL